MFRSKALMLSPLILAMGAVAAGAAEPKKVGGNEAWGAFVSGSGTQRVCFVHGAPRKSVGKYKVRGKTYFQVAHHPRDKKRDEASVTAGYTYKKGSTVKLVIDGKTFQLFTHRGTAWGDTEKEDRAIVVAMMKGAKMTVQGRSTRGTLTTDTYSLTGFTKAYRDASKACKVPVS